MKKQLSMCNKHVKMIEKNNTHSNYYHNYSHINMTRKHIYLLQTSLICISKN